MRRTLAAILALTLAVQALSASGRPEAVAVLGTLAEYSYNPTWGGSMAADLAGRVTFDDYLEFEPAVQLSTAGVHTAALRTRTILPLGKPALTFGALVLMRDYARSGMYDASLGLSAGVRVPHFDGELGMFSRFIDRRRTRSTSPSATTTSISASGSAGTPNGAARFTVSR